MSKQLFARSSSRKAASSIFSFFLAFFLAFAVAGTAVLSHVMFASLLNSLFDDQYCEDVKSYVEAEALYYTLPTGFPTEVLDGVFDAVTIKDDVKSYVRACYQGKDHELATTLLEKRISDNVSAYITSVGQTITDEATLAINEYSADIVEIYKTGIEIPGMDVLAARRSSILLVGCIVVVVLLALCLALVISLKRMHHFVHRAQRYWCYATGGAALMCIVGPLVLFFFKPYRGLNFSPEFFYNLAMKLVDHLLLAIVIGGVILLVISIVLYVVSSKNRREVIQRSRKHSHMAGPSLDMDKDW